MNTLDDFVQQLDREAANKLLVQLIERLIETEEICFYPDTSPQPYWDATGDAIDGSDRTFKD